VNTCACGRIGMAPTVFLLQSGSAVERDALVE